MGKQPLAEDMPDPYQRGREAVGLLWEKWRDRPTVEDPHDDDFARGALEEIIARLENSPDIDKEIREFSETAAEQVTTASRTILEIIQNADDLGATNLKLAVRRRGNGEIMAVHNGQGVEVADVIAMTLAFLSRKRQDSRSKGRFGIGLKTLNQVGSRLSVHCAPYHFAVEKGMLSIIRPHPAIRCLYEPRDKQTLLSIELDREYTPDDVERWAKAVDAPHLLFLDQLHEFSVVNTRSSQNIHLAKIEAKITAKRSLQFRPGFSLESARVVFTDARKKRRRWTRYSVDYRVPKGLKRAYKATGDLTQLSIAISERAESGFLSTGLPLDGSYDLPISLNAQFDPDLSRRGVQENSWNIWLFERLAEMTSAVALDRFQSDPKAGWYAVPLREESAASQTWIAERLSALTEKVQTRLTSQLHLRVEDQWINLEQLSFVDALAQGLILEEDQRFLAPDFIPLPTSVCDRHGRWRSVLDELGTGKQLGIDDALTLLRLPEDELGEREALWFTQLAACALASGRSSEIEAEKSLLCEDGSRAAPRGDVLLVQEELSTGIASYLGLQKVLAPIYFADTTPDEVRAWALKQCAPPGADSGLHILDVLARRSAEEPLLLDDKSLLLLRDALMNVDVVRRGALAASVGGVVAVRGYEFIKGRKVDCMVTPGGAYLPTSIAKDTGGWAAAAKATEGLFWIDPQYGPLLSTGRSAKLGARRLFMMLGARPGPRIIQSQLGSREALPDLVNPAQFAAWQQLTPRPTHIERDSFSPDLDRVMKDISKQRVDEKRRARSRALYETLARDWDDYLSEHAEAAGIYHYYQWRTSGHLPATWLANVAAAPWLSTKSKRKIAPLEAAIETVTTRLTRGTKASKFVAEISERDSANPLVAALGIKGTPPASELLSELKMIKEKHHAIARVEDVHPLYAALGALAVGDRSSDLGDLKVVEVRRQFETHALLLTQQGWKGPSAVYRGKQIFGEMRGFVPEGRQLKPLWQILQITEPDLSACLAVTNELSQTGEAPDKKQDGIIVDVLRRLSELEFSAVRNARQLKRMPLWTTRGWQSKRPVYATFDKEVEAMLGKDIPIWLLGCSVRSLGGLPERLGVELLTESDFTVMSAITAEPADEFTALTYRAAVAHLRSELGKKSQELWDAIDWPSLQKIELLQAHVLSAYTIIRGHRYSFPRRLHVEQAAKLYFVSADDLGQPEAGERILAPFIKGDLPAIIDLAWSYAWHKAETEGSPEDELLIASKEEELEDPLRYLASKGRKAAGKRLFGTEGAGGADTRSKRKLPPAPKPRRLKDFAGATIGSVTIAEGETNKREIKRTKKPLKRAPWNSKTKQGASKAGGKAPVKEWSERERELQGFELLAGALKEMDDLQLEDFSALRGIGADSIDNLRRFFELKVFAGAPADEVRFEPSEVQRALQSKGDYFLAIVSGLEEGYETQIKIFADPVRTLPIRRVSQIRLGGVRSSTSRSLVIKVNT